MDRARILSLSITSFEIGAKRAKFTLLVQGRTRFMHPLANCKEYKKSTRHSKILAFHESLTQSLSKVKLPKCPKKRLFHSHSKVFYEKRTEKLNEYLRQVLMVEGVQTSEALFKLVSPRKTYSIGIIAHDDTAYAERIASLFINHNNDNWASQPRNDIFEKFANRSPIDIICKDKIKRINDISIVQCTQESINESTRNAFMGLDGIIVAHSIQSQDNRKLPLFIEKAICDIIPSVVLDVNDIKDEHMQIMESFQHVLEIAK